MRRTHIIALGALALLFGRSAAGQRFGADVAVHAAEHRVDAGLGLEVSSGPLVSVAARAMLISRLTLRVEALTGALAPDETTSAIDHDVNQFAGMLGYDLTRWLTLDAVLSTRVYTAPIGTQRWTTLSLGALFRVPFTGPRVEAVARLAWLPSVTVTDIGETSPGIQAAAGVNAHIADFSVALAYWLERYEFPPAGGVTRLERLSGLMLQASWRPGLP